MTTIKTVTSSQASTPYQQLMAIFDKVTHGVALTALEKSFLSQSAQATPSLGTRVWSVWSTPADEESVQTINSLAERIQTRAIPVTRIVTEAEGRFRACLEPTIRETASFAKLIQSCLFREDVLTSLLSRFRTQYGKDPDRNELIKLVAQCNAAAFPAVDAAGQIVVQVVVQVEYINERFDTPGRLTVKYNREGFLEITEGPLAVLDTRFTQKLTKAQIVEMNALYDRLSKDTPFNNLGEMLEFINYFNQQRMVKPELTLKQALASYNPNLPQIFDKYRSGTCVMLSAKVCHEFANRGIQAQMMSTFALNPWSSLPIPGKEVELPWIAFSKELQGVDHTDAVCFYTSEELSEEILRFRCSYEKDLEDEVITYIPAPRKGALAKLLFDIGDNDLPNRVIDIGKTGKTRLIGQYKALIKKDDMILGIDFLRGNLYFKPTPGPDALKGLPLNEKGIVSIELSDLANPQAKGFYFINGARVELSHREALRIILARAGHEVHLPAGTEENLILVAQNAPALMADFFIQPLPLIQQAHKDLVAIDKQLKNLEGKISPDARGILMERYEAEIITAICSNSADALEKVRSFRAEIEAL